MEGARKYNLGMLGGDDSDSDQEVGGKAGSAPVPASATSVIAQSKLGEVLDRDGGIGVVESSTFDLRTSLDGGSAGLAGSSKPAWVSELERSGKSDMLPQQAQGSSGGGSFESELDAILDGKMKEFEEDQDKDKFNFARLAAQASGQEDAALKLGTQAWDFSGLSAEASS